MSCDVPSQSAIILEHCIVTAEVALCCRQNLLARRLICSVQVIPSFHIISLEYGTLTIRIEKPDKPYPDLFVGRSFFAELDARRCCRSSKAYWLRAYKLCLVLLIGSHDRCLILKNYSVLCHKIMCKSGDDTLLSPELRNEKPFASFL